MEDSTRVRTTDQVGADLARCIPDLIARFEAELHVATNGQTPSARDFYEVQQAEKLMKEWKVRTQ